MKKVLNLGCGPKHYTIEDKDTIMINIDKDKLNNPNIVADLEKGLPFDDNSIEEIYSEHFLEHISPDEINFFMYECWRVLKDKGLFRCRVPIGDSWMTSPFHKSPMSANTPLFFTTWNDPKKSGYKFEIVKHNVNKGQMIDTIIDWADELDFTLRVIKEVKKEEIKQEKENVKS